MNHKMYKVVLATFDPPMPFTGKLNMPGDEYGVIFVYDADADVPVDAFRGDACGSCPVDDSALVSYIKEWQSSGCDVAYIWLNFNIEGNNLFRANQFITAFEAGRDPWEFNAFEGVFSSRAAQ
jgi:hypothetical protein